MTQPISPGTAFVIVYLNTQTEPKTVQSVRPSPATGSTTQHDTSPRGTGTSWQAPDVARRAGLGLALHKVESLPAILSEGLLVTDTMLSPAW